MVLSNHSANLARGTRSHYAGFNDSCLFSLGGGSWSTKDAVDAETADLTSPFVYSTSFVPRSLQIPQIAS